MAILMDRVKLCPMNQGRYESFVINVNLYCDPQHCLPGSSPGKLYVVQAEVCAPLLFDQKL